MTSECEWLDEITAKLRRYADYRNIDDEQMERAVLLLKTARAEVATTGKYVSALRLIAVLLAEVDSLRKQRSEAVAIARQWCEEMDFANDWPDDLHLADVMEKRLCRLFREEIRMRDQRIDACDTLCEAKTDHIKNLVSAIERGGFVMTHCTACGRPVIALDSGEGGMCRECAEERNSESH